jgi:hypothetical protein
MHVDSGGPAAEMVREKIGCAEPDPLHLPEVAQEIEHQSSIQGVKMVGINARRGVAVKFGA